MGGGGMGAGYLRDVSLPQEIKMTHKNIMRVMLRGILCNIDNSGFILNILLCIKIFSKTK